MTRVADLSNADQLLQAQNSNNQYGPPNGQWTALNCSGSENFNSYCVWRNPHGDEAAISVDGNKFGQVCFQSECVDVKTGVQSINGVPVTTTVDTPAAAAVEAPAAEDPAAPAAA